MTRGFMRTLVGSGFAELLGRLPLRLGRRLLLPSCPESASAFPACPLANMLVGLIQVETGLSTLDDSLQRPDISEKFVSTRDSELRAIGTLFTAVLPPATGLGHVYSMR
jgi:hypothetical protein